MGGVTVSQVDHHKHLGIHFNKSLTWTDHVNEVFSMCARRIGMLRRLRRILPNAASYSKNLHCLEHACPVWCGGPIAKLVKLQESFCRRHHIMLPPLTLKRFDYHTLILFYKIKSNLAPAYLTELLPSPSHNSGHTFRKELYPVPLVKKSSSLSSFLPRSIILWNTSSLLSELQKSSSLSTFKSALKSHLCT